MSNKKIPMRQCVGCHEMKAKRDMIRVIKTAPTEEGETEIILDATGRKNGRGAYICPNRECLAMAIKNKGLERSIVWQCLVAWVAAFLVHGLALLF